MKLISYSFLLLYMLLFSANYSLAQNNEPIQKEWLARYVEGLKFLSKTTPIEKRTFESLQEIIGASNYESNSDFGARTSTFSIYNNSTTFSVSAFTFKGVIIHYEIRVSGDSSNWQQIRKSIIEAWEQNSNLEFTESKSGIYYEREFPEVLEAYKSAVSNVLGKMKFISVPADLAKAYEYLISPKENSVVGSSGGCGESGITPQGREAIDAIVKAKRIDLIENILRGYNAGGRVYAALALLEMEKQGFKLSEDAQNGIRKISSLDIKIKTCSGCMYSFQTAKEILSEPNSF